MFISTERGFVNSDAVIEIVSSRTKDAVGKYPAHAVLRDGSTVGLEWSAEETIKRLTPVIPALPGFEMLMTWWDSEDSTLRVERHPVLGWREDPSTGLLPVVLEDEDLYSNASLGGIRYPDGRVVCVADAIYADEEKWFVDMQKRELKYRANKAVA
jgi:hypothetical protein